MAFISEVFTSAAVDGLVMRNASPQGARLSNTEVLSNLPHLHHDRSIDNTKVIYDIPSLSRYIFSQTSFITHDIALTNPMPIKQWAYWVSPAKREVMKKSLNVYC